jgi:hypothetical protein
MPGARLGKLCLSCRACGDDFRRFALKFACAGLAKFGCFSENQGTGGYTRLNRKRTASNRDNF